MRFTHLRAAQLLFLTQTNLGWRNGGECGRKDEPRFAAKRNLVSAAAAAAPALALAVYHQWRQTSPAVNYRCLLDYKRSKEVMLPFQENTNVICRHAPQMTRRSTPGSSGPAFEGFLAAARVMVRRVTTQGSAKFKNPARRYCSVSTVFSIRARTS